ncbi:MAG: hypothetical protein ABIQ97_00850 [Lysobacteraceae bacterium]
MSRPLLLLSAAVLAFATSAAGWAGGGGDRGKAQDRNHASTRARQVDTTLPDSVRRAERETGGQVLRAQPIQRDGREVYRVKVLTPDGRVKVVEDDREAPQRSNHPTAPANPPAPPEPDHR